jgi:diaminopimelate epimerase
MADWARALCPRAFAVGADGLIFLEPTPEAETAYRWHFFNADGSRAEMCGNASRCAARLAVELGLAGPEHSFGTDAGPIQARVLEGGVAKVQLTPPEGLALGEELTVDGTLMTVHFVNTGVPHAVVVCEDVAAVDVAAKGAAIRYHEHFAPAGTNANFIQATARDALLLRTYERGVEGETYACGTGAAASLVVANALGLVGSSARVTTSGGEVLTVSLENGSVFLQGMAVKVYEGTLEPAMFGLSI